MLTAYNRGGCFNCGKPVGAEDYADIGGARVWVCTNRECVREAGYAMVDTESDARHAAEEDGYRRYY